GSPDVCTSYNTASMAGKRGTSEEGPGRSPDPGNLAPESRALPRPLAERLRSARDVRAVVDPGPRARVERAADRRTDRRHRHGTPADAVRRRYARALRGSRGLLGQPPRPGLRHVL